MALAAAVALVAGGAVAGPPQALAPVDAKLYADAFTAAERGDFGAADQDLAQVSDKCLAGRIQFLELTNPTRNPSYDDLAAWLKTFGDMPGADRIYAMALKKKPAGAEPPAPIAMPAPTEWAGDRSHPSAQYRPAREAFFSGDVSRALGLARASGDAWIAGLAAYRLGAFTQAMASFEAIATNPTEKDGTRSAGGFWAARAAAAAGLTERVTPYLKMAAEAPDTFYGMIAARKLELADDPLGNLIEAATRPRGQEVLLSTAVYRRPGNGSAPPLIDADLRARRAAALAQLGRAIDAGAELRVGLAEADDDPTRAAWMRLAFQLNPSQPQGEIVLHSQAGPTQPHQVYPTPALSPTGGYAIDKALVYAIAYQESRFNSIAVSPKGAVGMMQLMPPSAANVAGDSSLASDPMPLFDAGKNLQLGQQYLVSLIEHSTGEDLMRAVAAYNGGPGTVARTEATVGADVDTLTLVESLPFAETRDYVRKVMAAYWTYRRQFGAANRTLDAAASDALVIDARLDAASPSTPSSATITAAPAPQRPLAPLGGSAVIENAQYSSAPAREALEILLHRPGA